MEYVKSPEELASLKDNLFYGALPKMVNSAIKFSGRGNLLFCENGVTLKNSIINFNGSNSIIYLSEIRNAFFLNAALYNNNTLFFGKNCYLNNIMTIILSEQGSFFAGDDCIFSHSIHIRTADPHLIYDAESMKRINPTKSVFLGDHVWIGQSALLFKGSRISSGAIIGAGSVVSGKAIPHNSSWAGNPVRHIASQIFWDSSCVHAWTDKNTEEADSYINYSAKRGVAPDRWIYSFNEDEYIPFDTVEEHLSHKYSAGERLEYLQNLAETPAKNRFAFN